jgi:NAD+ kinase
LAKSSSSVVIVAKPAKPELAQILPRLMEWLRAHKFSVFVDPETSAYIAGSKSQSGHSQIVQREAIAGKKPDFVIVLGGDGTLLAAARAVAAAKIPLLAVNLGSLGFLTEVALADLYPTLEAVYSQRCGIERRAMIHCRLVRAKSAPGEKSRPEKPLAEFDALNDIVVNKAAIARLADFDVQVDNDFVSNYKADGIIVATPTGSTAYSLAAGGPIVAPDVDAFIITPVSPHALTNRPLVVRGSAEIEIVINSPTQEAVLTVDGQLTTVVRDGDRVLCKKSANHIELLRLNHQTFFEALRTKLKWGQR